MSDDEPIAASASEASAQDDAATNVSSETSPDTPTSAQTSAQTGAQNDADARIADLERQLAAERDAATDYMQKWRQAVADFANFKRRAQQEQEQRERLLAAEALAPVLSALDSFERAFASLPDSLRGYSWIEGVALVDYQLRRALDAQGITEAEAEPGQPFDPTRHHAVGEVESDQHPAGYIAVVVQRGYQASGLLIRPALVQVARAPEASEAAAPLETSDAPDTDGTPPTGPAP